MYVYPGYFNVIIKGRDIDEYKKDGKVFVEGRQGSNYELKFYNASGSRKKVVLSVDGLNILTGDKDWSRGYVVDPWQTITIPGWRKDSDNVAKFVFSSIKDSYNQHNDSGDKNNIGVIGAMVFDETAKPLSIFPQYHYLNNSPLRSWGSCDSLIGSSVGSSMTGTNALNASAMNCSYTSSDSSAIASRPRSAKAAVPQNSVGTGWGKNESFHTTEVHYDFYSVPQSTLLIYYDSRKGLRRRGIDIKEPEAYVAPAPQAFPGFGCPAPK